MISTSVHVSRQRNDVADYLFKEDRMINVQIVGIVAGVLTATSMLPQLIKVLKEKEVENLSIVMLLVLLGGLALWAVYGFMKEDWPIIVTNCFSLLVNLLLIFFRLRYADKS